MLNWWIISDVFETKSLLSTVNSELLKSPNFSIYNPTPDHYGRVHLLSSAERVQVGDLNSLETDRDS